MLEPIKRLKSNMIYCSIVLAGWLAVMGIFDLWHLFKDNWFMSVTMAFGSFIAGATSEGGGAVAFPVMTLLFKIAPATARDFSLLIQSFGMTSATLVIFKNKIPIVKKAIVISCLGAIAGNILAFNYLAGLFSPPALKLFFCSLWLSFGIVLILVKKSDQTRREQDIPEGIMPYLMLFSVGILGGAVTGLTGSGLDILTFSMLTLYFNICEKVATPTSVVMMAANSITAALLKTHHPLGISSEAFQYLLVCLPIVIFGAPLGSLFINEKNRNFILGLLLTTISIQFIAALIIIPLDGGLIALTILTFLAGVLFFIGINKVSRHNSRQGHGEVACNQK